MVSVKPVAGIACVPGLHAQIVTGPAEAIDADTLDLTRTRIRLFEIDASSAGSALLRADPLLGNVLPPGGTRARNDLSLRAQLGADGGVPSTS